jgi:hypothetical protein
MEKKIAVITLHGMGDTNPNYYKEIEKSCGNMLVKPHGIQMFI